MNETFAKDVLEGLSAKNKHLSSKYFYDDNGSRIFQEIMHMPEYYLTDSEFEILSLQAKQIIDSVGFSKPFNIIDIYMISIVSRRVFLVNNIYLTKICMINNFICQ